VKEGVGNTQFSASEFSKQALFRFFRARVMDDQVLAKLKRETSDSNRMFSVISFFVEPEFLVSSRMVHACR